MAEKLTIEQIQESYRLGIQAYEHEDEMTVAKAIQALATHSMPNLKVNKNTGGTLIRGLKKMMEGEGYEHGISGDILRVYLENILSDPNYGEDKVEICLNAIEEYFARYPNYKNISECKVHDDFCIAIGKVLVYNVDGSNEDEKLKGKLLKDIWQISNVQDYKIHFARKNRYGHPLDLCAKDPHEWIKWMEHRPGHHDFNRKYVFSIMRFHYDGMDVWLFGGIFEVLNRDGGHESGYKVRLTDQLAEYIGRLKLIREYKLPAPRVDLENHYNEFEIKEVLDKPYFTIASAPQFDKSEGDDIEIIEKSQSTESQDIAEPYKIDNIIKEGCFIEREELDKFLKRLEDKKNLILQGPPGTGKTWLAKKLGNVLIGSIPNNQLKAVQFHPTTSYEDFIMGYRPNEESKLSLERGTFLKFIDRAKRNPDRDFVMIIEEINRGNPVQIFGEMLTLLEADKRKPEEALLLCYQDEKESKSNLFCIPNENNQAVYIPDNLYVIGTMNLTDKSLGTLDFAFRRRFAFIDLEPQYNETWLEYVKEHFPVGKKGVAEKIEGIMNDWNEKIREEKSLGKQYCIGHSYFTPKRKNKEVTEDEIINEPEAWFNGIFETEIIPLIEEYWLDDFESINDGEWEPMEKSSD